VIWDAPGVPPLDLAPIDGVADGSADPDVVEGRHAGVQVHGELARERVEVRLAGVPGGESLAQIAGGWFHNP